MVGFRNSVRCALFLLCAFAFALAQEKLDPSVETRIDVPIKKPITYVAATKDNYLKFADEAEHMLRQDILGKWFPACVDNLNGGFNASFDRQWKPVQSEGKFSVF